MGVNPTDLLKHTYKGSGLSKIDFNLHQMRHPCTNIGALKLRIKPVLNPLHGVLFGSVLLPCAFECFNPCQPSFLRLGSLDPPCILDILRTVARTDGFQPVLFTPVPTWAFSPRIVSGMGTTVRSVIPHGDQLILLLLDSLRILTVATNEHHPMIGHQPR